MNAIRKNKKIETESEKSARIACSSKAFRKPKIEKKVEIDFNKYENEIKEGMEMGFKYSEIIEYIMKKVSEGKENLRFDYN